MTIIWIRTALVFIGLFILIGLVVLDAYIGFNNHERIQTKVKATG